LLYWATAELSSTGTTCVPAGGAPGGVVPAASEDFSLGLGFALKGCSLQEN
jgi:hypothetical protein